MGATQPKQLPGLSSDTGGDLFIRQILARRRGADQGLSMQARLTAVQRALVLLPFASLAVALIARPHPENRTLVGVLSEVSAFHASYNRENAEKYLRDAAEAQGMLSPELALAGAPASAALGVAQSTGPIRPLSVVSLTNLSDAHAYGRADSTLTIGVPDLSGVGAALTWRLTHEGASGPVQISGLEIISGQASADDIALETEVAALQAAKQSAKAAVDSATKRLEAEQNLFEARRKRGLPWKVILKSIEARDAAKVILTERSAALADVEGRYTASVERATSAREQTSFSAIPAFALARVSLTAEASEDGSATTTLKSVDIPVRIEARTVSVPALVGASFTQTTEAGLWDKVSQLDAAGAVQAVRDEFNWHNRFMEVAGLRLGGMTLLQILPCLLPLLTLLILRRANAAAKSYSLFGTEVHNGTMPGVGFKSRALEGLSLLVLPLLACASAALALFFIGAFPVLPALSAAACLIIGSSAYSKLGELQTLVASVVHSHSYPPPPQPRV